MSIGNNRPIDRSQAQWVIGKGGRQHIGAPHHFVFEGVHSLSHVTFNTSKSIIEIIAEKRHINNEVFFKTHGPISHEVDLLVYYDAT